jgi:hypothetical protein
MTGPEIKINRIVGPEDEPECVVSPIDDDQITLYKDYVKAPWSVREVQKRNEIQFKILDNEEKIICQVTTKLKDQKYGKVIARLIAGAPRMVDQGAKVETALLFRNEVDPMEEIQKLIRTAKTIKHGIVEMWEWKE